MQPKGANMKRKKQCPTPAPNKPYNQFNAQGGIIAVCLKWSPHLDWRSAIKEFHAGIHALAQMRNEAKTQQRNTSQ